MHNDKTNEPFSNILKNHLKISNRSITVRTLLSDRNLKRINYEPYYQRNYVWDATKASFFIESILLGTEIPPLIFFKSGKVIEVIDGRQRFQTLKLFNEDNLKLKIHGLLTLPSLKGKTFNKLDDQLKEYFINAKVRIFEFEVINEPKLSDELEDKIKKEIFRRYNTGITPLKTSELDNAKYDKDELTESFESVLTNDSDLVSKINECFLRKRITEDTISNIVQFFRRYIVLRNFPIKSYARGNNRTEIIELLYQFTVDQIEDIDSEVEKFNSFIQKTLAIHEYVKSKGLDFSKLVYEAILWAFTVLDKEECDIVIDERMLNKIMAYYSEHSDKYGIEDSHYYSHISSRFSNTAQFFESMTGVDFSLYIKTDGFSSEVKTMRKSEKETHTTLTDLKELRFNKPDPTSVPVEEVISDLRSEKYLIRPSYQRQERINKQKASSIIESMLLGIYLPPIFIFKNNDNREVIDGQQRLLSILGFLGKQYCNEHNKFVFSKNNKYSLKGLKILKELEGKKFTELSETQKDKIEDFDLSIIEIDSEKNPKFSPVDLFIRLNNKPYPIRDNSFEMWNSIVSKDIVRRIKKLTDKNIDWFYIRQRNPNRFRDRMENEELITVLSYFQYQYSVENQLNIGIGFYTKQDRLNCRISDKNSISSLLNSLEHDVLKKNHFLDCIYKVELFIDTIEAILDPEDLKGSFNDLLNVKNAESYVRSLQDFYVIWLCLIDITPEKASGRHQQIKKDLELALKIFKNTNNKLVNNDYLEDFNNSLIRIRENYTGCA